MKKIVLIVILLSFFQLSKAVYTVKKQPQPPYWVVIFNNGDTIKASKVEFGKRFIVFVKKGQKPVEFKIKKRKIAKVYYQGEMSYLVDYQSVRLKKQNRLLLFFIVLGVIPLITFFIPLFSSISLFLSLIGILPLYFGIRNILKQRNELFLSSFWAINIGFFDFLMYSFVLLFIVAFIIFC